MQSQDSMHEHGLWNMSRQLRIIGRFEREVDQYTGYAAGQLRSTGHCMLSQWIAILTIAEYPCQHSCRLNTAVDSTPNLLTFVDTAEALPPLRVFLLSSHTSLIFLTTILHRAPSTFTISISFKLTHRKTLLASSFCLLVLHPKFISSSNIARNCFYTAHRPRAAPNTQQSCQLLLASKLLSKNFRFFTTSTHLQSHVKTSLSTHNSFPAYPVLSQDRHITCPYLSTRISF